MNRFPVALLLVGHVASAEPKAGELNITATVETSMSAGSVGKPTSIAPDITYGITDDLSIAAIHSAYGYNGFRGASGFGVCVTGDEHGCPEPYHDGGIEAAYRLIHGPLTIAVDGGGYAFLIPHSLQLRAKLGVKIKYAADYWYVTFNPSVDIALNGRDTNSPDQAYFPIAVAVKPTPELATGIGTGIKLPTLKNPGPDDSWLLALGVFAQYAIAPDLSVGASFVFGKLAGGDPSAGADDRHVQLWVSYTR